MTVTMSHWGKISAAEGEGGVSLVRGLCELFTWGETEGDERWGGWRRTERVVDDLFRVEKPAVDGAEEHECGYLQQADLQCVSGADLHRQGDVAVHGEGDGVL